MRSIQVAHLHPRSPEAWRHSRPIFSLALSPCCFILQTRYCCEFVCRRHRYSTVPDSGTIVAIARPRQCELSVACDEKEVRWSRCCRSVLRSFRSVFVNGCLRDFSAVLRCVVNHAAASHGGPLQSCATLRARGYHRDFFCFIDSVTS